MIENKLFDKDNLNFETISLTTIHLYDFHEVPDGGYGWIIVFAAFCNNIIADGLTFSFGIIFYELIENYDESHFKTSLFTCLFNGIPLLFAPVISFLTEKYSCRIIAVLGGYITHLGFFLSYFTNTFASLFLTLSIIAPIGLSCVYIPSIVMVSRYFDSKRAFATGIAVSGSGVGAIIFSPLIEHLCKNYTFKGSLLILSGIILHVSVFGLLFKPISVNGIDENKVQIFQKEYNKFLAKIGTMHKRSETYSQISELKSIAIESQKLIDHNNKIQVSNHQNYKNIAQDDDTAIKQQSNINSNKYVTTEKTPHSIMNVSVIVESLTFNTKEKSFSKTEISSSHTLVKQSIFLTGIKAYIIQDHRAIFGKRKVNRDMHFTIEAANDPNSIDFHHKFITKSRFQAKYILNLLKRNNSENVIKILWLFLCAIFDKKLLKRWSFSGFMISNFILYACFPVAYNNLPDYAQENEIHDTSRYPLLVGIGNCFGQVSLGFLGDRSFIQSIALYIFTLIICGFSCLILPVYKIYKMAYIVFSIIFGFTISANFSLCSVVLVDIFGIEQITSTYGMILFGQGMGSLFGPGICGYLRDINGTYDIGFMFSGLGMIFSSLLLIPLMIKQNVFINSYFNKRKLKYKKQNII